MGYDQKLIRLHGGLVLDDAVLGDPEAIQSSAQGGQTSGHNGPFQGAHNHQGKGTQHHQLAQPGNDEESRAKEKPPQASPEGPELPPELHPVPGVVEPDDILLGMVVLPHHGERLHVKARFLELFDRGIGIGVGLVDSNHCVLVAHFIPPFVFSGSYLT